MFSKYQLRFLALVTLVLLVGFLAAGRTRKMQRLQTGDWGGTHIRIRVENGSATIDYDCATGTINGPLTMNSKGNFTWRGSHNQEHAGPIRMNEESNGRPAIYSGSIKGDTMNLTVRLADTNEVIETYTLKRGAAGRVFKCK